MLDEVSTIADELSLQSVDEGASSLVESVRATHLHNGNITVKQRPKSGVTYSVDVLSPVLAALNDDLDGDVGAVLLEILTQ